MLWGFVLGYSYLKIDAFMALDVLKDFFKNFSTLTIQTIHRPV